MDYEPVYHHEFLGHQSPSRIHSDDSLTVGTRSPSVCSVDHYQDCTNTSGSTSCDGISVVSSSPVIQKQKMFNFCDDFSSVDSLSLGGMSLGFFPAVSSTSTSSLNIIAPQGKSMHHQNHQSQQNNYPMRGGYEYASNSYDSNLSFGGGSGGSSLLNNNINNNTSSASSYDRYSPTSNIGGMSFGEYDQPHHYPGHYNGYNGSQQTPPQQQSHYAHHHMMMNTNNNNAYPVAQHQFDQRINW